MGKRNNSSTMSLACSMIRVTSGSHHFLEETDNAYLLQLGQSTNTLFEDPQRTRNLSLLLVDRSVTQKLHGIAHAIILLHSSPQSTACSVCILPLPYLCEQRSIERLLSKRSASTLITSSFALPALIAIAYIVIHSDCARSGYREYSSRNTQHRVWTARWHRTTSSRLHTRANDTGQVFIYGFEVTLSVAGRNLNQANSKRSHLCRR